jgi:hypothetical protein
LEFSGAIAAVLVLLLQTICGNRDLRESGPTEKTLSVSLSRAKHKTPKHATPSTAKEQLDCCRPCRLGNTVRTLSGTYLGNVAVVLFVENYFILLAIAQIAVFS